MSSALLFMRNILLRSRGLWFLTKHLHKVLAKQKAFEEELRSSQERTALQRETEHLVAQIMILAPSSAKAIPKILQAIAESLHWEIGTFWENDYCLQKIRCTHTWTSPSINTDEFTEKSRELIFSLGVGLPGAVWKNRKSCWIRNLAHTPHFSRAVYAVKEGLHSAFAFPICLGEEVLGVMEFFSREIKNLDKTWIQMFDSLGNQMGQFMERKETEEKLQLAYEELEKRVEERTTELIQANRNLQTEILERKKAEKEVLEIAHKEQRRFGAHLHDGLCQDLAGISMITRALTQKMENKNNPEADELRNISNLLQGAVNQVRNTARGLYPGELEGTSLIDYLQELTSRTQSLWGVSCRFHCLEPILIEDNHVVTHLYRIAQEGISNAVKHGKAQQIEVSLIKDNDQILFTIKDDGIGFTHESKNSQGIGLNIMKYRARMMEASLQIESNLPHGVVLTCGVKSPIHES